ncbi:unnamed protein product [Ambrosiozyma monospora]|uniref:Unnamed protein product n=1 Tax=Ambrosiozyma monospora TaxID=43982 RepID=A0ACB5T9L9_AMBMO|nr:unnamed protein product [Ambrosiozyma monospora]
MQQPLLITSNTSTNTFKMITAVQPTLPILLLSLQVCSGFPLPIKNPPSRLLSYTTFVNSTTKTISVSKRYVDGAMTSGGHNSARKVALGLGIGLPVGFILVMVILGICVLRQNKKKRSAIEKEKFSVNNNNGETGTFDRSDSMMVPDYPSAPPAPAYQHATRMITGVSRI